MQYSDFKIALICALPVELAAVEGMLDEAYESLPRKEGDSNTYRYGRIGKHNVVLACLPAGSTGTVSAAGVAANVKTTFHGFKMGLMVGIGGGVPDMEAEQQYDIRLGDVVVSKPTATFGGVVQYDIGKTVQGGRFTRTGSLNRPPNALLTAVTVLESKHMMEDSRAPIYLSEMLEKYPKMRSNFSRQQSQRDQLFRASYEHLETSRTCDNCDSAKLIRRPCRDDGQIVIHYGTIASGDQVMRHGQTRDKIAADLGALCFEMEAAGLMNQFPCLVIRGICDYADSHKNKWWQPHAAAVAAAYAKELLYIIPAEEIESSLTVSQVTATPPAQSSNTPPKPWVEPILNRAQETFKLARANYFCGNQYGARRLCSQALDELSEVRKTAKVALEQLMWLFYALVSAAFGEEKTIEESRRLLATVNVQELQQKAIQNVSEPLVLDRMVLICWINFRLEKLDEAEKCCRDLINNVEDWSNDKSLFYDLNILLALITYSQHNEKEGISLVRIIPKPYLQQKYHEAIGSGQHDAISKSQLETLSKSGCEAAALYFVHYGSHKKHAELALKAAEEGSVPVIAMLIAQNAVTIVTEEICSRHNSLRCSKDGRYGEYTDRFDDCWFYSPWGIIVSRRDFRLLHYVLEALSSARSAPYLDERIEETIRKTDDVKLFEILFHWALENRQKRPATKKFENPIHLAVRCNAPRILDHLLQTEHRVQIDQVDSKSGTSPLVLACQNRQTRMVKTLIENGAAVESSRQRLSPVHEAIKEEDLGILEILSNKGAALDEYSDVEGKGRITPLQHAVRLYLESSGRREMKLDIIGFLVSRGAKCMKSGELKSNCVYLATKNGEDELLQRLLDTKGDMNIDQAYDGLTILQWVLGLNKDNLFGSEECIEILVKRGANPMALYSDRQSCLHRAMGFMNAAKLLRALLKSTRPINLSHRDDAGRTVADLARQETGRIRIGLRFVPKREDQKGKDCLSVLNKFEKAGLGRKLQMS